ncbi:MAG: PD-(D/E)XK nuclease family protein [Salibacteraceae bacterium]
MSLYETGLRLTEQPFLERLAAHISGLNQDVLVVMPNERSVSVLGKYTTLPKSLEILSADDLMQELTGLELVDPEETLVAFYHTYLQMENKPQPFTEFSKWAAVFLSDINEIDLYLGDIDDIYKHVSEYKETGADYEWGDLESSFRSFWRTLPSYYHALKENLKKVGIGYRGLIYREAAEQCEATDIKQSRFCDKVLLWVGVIPGNKSEQKLLDWISDGGALERFVDVDAYYMDRMDQEAGRLFQKDNALRTAKWKIDALASNPYNAHIHPISGQFGQVSRTIDLIKEIPKSDYPNTVVVLVDETLLRPLQTLIDSNGIEANITVGLKLKTTKTYDFIVQWIMIHENSYTHEDQQWFYGKQLETFLLNPIHEQWSEGPAIWRRIEPILIDRNMKYVSANMIKEAIPSDLFGQERFELLFSLEHNFSFIVDRISTVLEYISDANDKRLDAFEASAIKLSIKRLRQCMSQFSEVFDSVDLKTIRTFIHHQIGYAKLSMFQSNDDGLQIMGMLETRMVDYKNVIFLGASDDLLPGKGAGVSHLPFMHRKHFGLPTKYDTLALNAYHFYRLIQRSDTIHFLYNASAEALSGGEPSRFIMQLQLELGRINPHFKIQEVISAGSIDREAMRPLEVRKTPSVIQALRAYFNRRVSPSSLNKFINSPLEFYFYHVLNVKEEEVLEEDMAARTFGSAVHDTLELIYAPMVGQLLNTAVLEDRISEVDEMIDKKFLKSFTVSDLNHGKNFLQVQLAKDYVKAFIKYDMEDIASNGAIKLVAIEDRLSIPLKVEDETLQLFGFADRIDVRNNQYRIMDYKTGNVAPRDLKCTSEQLFKDPHYGKALQLAFYKWAFAKREGVDVDYVDSVIYSFRAQKEGYMSLDMPHSGHEFVKEFESGVGRLVQEMLDETMPFAHSPDSKYTTV